jgi:molybdopterin converting factor subunit 1
MRVRLYVWFFGDGFMKVQVRLFAAARELVGSGSMVQALPAQATVRDLVDVLAETWSGLREMQLKFAVNSTYASPETVLCDGDEVACIPPVGGG